MSPCVQGRSMYGLEWLRKTRLRHAGVGIRPEVASGMSMSGFRPEAVLERPVLDLAAVAAGLRVQTQVVEVDVRGDLERGAHVDRAVGGAARVVEGDPADVERARVVEDRARRDQVILERRCRGDRLERRPGRVAALVRAVDERVAGLVAECVVLRLRVGLRVEGRVVGRVGAHRRGSRRCGRSSPRRRLAGPWREAPPRPPPACPSRASAAGCRRPGRAGCRASAARAAQRVHLDPLAAGGAAQELVVGVLDARLPDDVPGLQVPVRRPVS